ncbi:MAG: DUF1851 domain-containing protein [Blastocatellia bacterium]|nr:DUF1851 domain-containing protein [Blastocatellia bacterium]
MNPIFIATPTREDVANSLSLWPELAGLRVMPLLVTAFGDIYVETQSGEVWVVDPLQLTSEMVAGSSLELQGLFSDPVWAAERLLSDLILLAEGQGKRRAAHQVFSVAPHPCFTGEIHIEHLVPVDLPIWHYICAQLRTTSQSGQRDG